MSNFITRYLLPFLAVAVLFLGTIANLEIPLSYRIGISIFILFARVIMLEYELAQAKSARPKLIYGGFSVERKIIDTERLPELGNDHLYHSFSPEDVIGEVFDCYIVSIWISNNPVTRNNEISISKDTIAHITFNTSKGDITIKGRWWTGNEHLFPAVKNVENLRKRNITPLDPERLVIAYKVKGANIFYPFAYNTHEEMKKQREEFNLGRGIVNFQVVLESLNLNRTPPLKFVLEGSDEDIKIKPR